MISPHGSLHASSIAVILDTYATGPSEPVEHALGPFKRHAGPSHSRVWRSDVPREMVLRY